METAPPAAAGSDPGAAGAGATVLGALLGGVAGGLLVVGVTLVLKAGMDFVGAQRAWFAVALPLLGLVVATLVLQGYGLDDAETGGARRNGGPARWRLWRTFPNASVRADISGDVVDNAGSEERFPWRLAPIRTAAIIATVGSGAAMGTEAPAAYLGVATGVCLGDRGRRWRTLLRPAAVAGGAAGVAALMGAALVGAAFILELGWRRRAPLSFRRVAAALIGGLVGWGIQQTFNLQLIRLIVPHDPPRNLAQAVSTALFIGLLSGGITALAGAAIYRVKGWEAPPIVRLVAGGLCAAAAAWLLIWIASPAAAVGPGAGAILWAERTRALPPTLLAVCLLRAAITTAAAAAGGCGGIFVPFLAIGDIGGRVFAPGLGISDDLAAASGAAAGIAGGYRLPFTAAFMVLAVGGPISCRLTCLATVAVGFFACGIVQAALERFKRSMVLGSR